MKNKIKVLQVCAVGFTVEKFLLPLIDGMDKYYEVAVACSRDRVSEGLAKRGYKIHYVNIDRKINFFGNLKTVIALYKLFRKEKFQVVHVHTPVAGILGRIAAKLAGVPVVIYTAHGFYFHDNMPKFKKNIYIFVEKVGGKLSDFIFTQSTEDYETGVKKKIILKTKILAIGNGIDIERFSVNDSEIVGKTSQVKEELRVKENEIVVGVVGRVVREKGYIEWVKAARLVIEKYKNVKFVAIGDTLESDRDGVKNELDRYIEQNNLKDNIIFTGSREDIPELLSIMDIFTLPSYREGMPRSLIEAMSMAKPVIATNIRGCREEVIDGITGFLIPVQDERELAEKIIYLMEHPELRMAMGESARKKVEIEFDEKIIIKRQLEVIERLLSAKLK